MRSTSGRKPEVQHLVGLVEHQRVDLAEGEVALLGEVEQAAGGADHDVDALAQGGELRLVGAATVDRDDPDAEVAARVGEVLGDLDAELAGGHHDEGLRHVAGAVGGLAVGGGGRALGGRHEPLQQRHAEAERLAHAGAGLADDVLARQRERERELLDGERADDARFGQRLHDLGADAELGEGGGVLADRGACLERVRFEGLFGGFGGDLWGDFGGVFGRDGQGDRLSPRAFARGRLVDRPRRGRRPGRRADKALHAQCRLRLPGTSGGRGKARSRRAAAHHTRTALPTSGCGPASPVT